MAGGARQMRWPRACSRAAPPLPRWHEASFRFLPRICRDSASLADRIVASGQASAAVRRPRCPRRPVVLQRTAPAARRETRPAFDFNAQLLQESRRTFPAGLDPQPADTRRLNDCAPASALRCRQPRDGRQRRCHRRGNHAQFCYRRGLRSVQRSCRAVHTPAAPE